MSRYYSYETIKDNAKDVTLKNGVKHRCIDPDALLDIESADVRENVKGEWNVEYTGNGWNDYIDVTCTNCGKTIKHGEPFNFCPNCGAQMER